MYVAKLAVVIVTVFASYSKQDIPDAGLVTPNDGSLQNLALQKNFKTIITTFKNAPKLLPLLKELERKVYGILAESAPQEVLDLYEDVTDILHGVKVIPADLIYSFIQHAMQRENTTLRDFTTTVSKLVNRNLSHEILNVISKISDILEENKNKSELAQFSIAVANIFDSWNSQASAVYIPRNYLQMISYIRKNFEDTWPNIVGIFENSRKIPNIIDRIQCILNENVEETEFKAVKDFFGTIVKIYRNSTKIPLREVENSVILLLNNTEATPQEALNKILQNAFYARSYPAVNNLVDKLMYEMRKILESHHSPHLSKSVNTLMKHIFPSFVSKKFSLMGFIYGGGIFDAPNFQKSWDSLLVSLENNTELASLFGRFEGLLVNHLEQCGVQSTTVLFTKLLDLIKEAIKLRMPLGTTEHLIGQLLDKHDQKDQRMLKKVFHKVFFERHYPDLNVVINDILGTIRKTLEDSHLNHLKNFVENLIVQIIPPHVIQEKECPSAGPSYSPPWAFLDSSHSNEPGSVSDTKYASIIGSIKELLWDFIDSDTTKLIPTLVAVTQVLRDGGLLTCETATNFFKNFVKTYYVEIYKIVKNFVEVIGKEPLLEGLLGKLKGLLVDAYFEMVNFAEKFEDVTEDKEKRTKILHAIEEDGYQILKDVTPDISVNLLYGLKYIVPENSEFSSIIDHLLQKLNVKKKCLVKNRDLQELEKNDKPESLFQEGSNILPEKGEKSIAETTTHLVEGEEIFLTSKSHEEFVSTLPTVGSSEIMSHTNAPQEGGNNTISTTAFLQEHTTESTSPGPFREETVTEQHSTPEQKYLTSSEELFEGSTTVLPSSSTVESLVKTEATVPRPEEKYPTTKIFYGEFLTVSPSTKSHPEATENTVISSGIFPTTEKIDGDVTESSELPDTGYYSKGYTTDNIDSSKSEENSNKWPPQEFPESTTTPSTSTQIQTEGAPVTPDAPKTTENTEKAPQVAPQSTTEASEPFQSQGPTTTIVGATGQDTSTTDNISEMKQENLKNTMRSSTSSHTQGYTIQNSTLKEPEISRTTETIDKDLEKFTERTTEISATTLTEGATKTPKVSTTHAYPMDTEYPEESSEDDNLASSSTTPGYMTEKKFSGTETFGSTEKTTDVSRNSYESTVGTSTTLSTQVTADASHSSTSDYYAVQTENSDESSEEEEENLTSTETQIDSTTQETDRGGPNSFTTTGNVATTTGKTFTTTNHVFKVPEGASEFFPQTSTTHETPGHITELSTIENMNTFTQEFPEIITVTSSPLQTQEFMTSKPHVAGQTTEETTKAPQEFSENLGLTFSTPQTPGTTSASATQQSTSEKLSTFPQEFAVNTTGTSSPLHTQGFTTKKFQGTESEVYTSAEQTTKVPRVFSENLALTALPYQTPGFTTNKYQGTESEVYTSAEETTKVPREFSENLALTALPYETPGYTTETNFVSQPELSATEAITTSPEESLGSTVNTALPLQTHGNTTNVAYVAETESYSSTERTTKVPQEYAENLTVAHLPAHTTDFTANKYQGTESEVYTSAEQKTKVPREFSENLAFTALPYQTPGYTTETTFVSQPELSATEAITSSPEESLGSTVNTALPLQTQGNTTNRAYVAETESYSSTERTTKVSQEFAENLAVTSFPPHTTGYVSEKTDANGLEFFTTTQNLHKNVTSAPIPEQDTATPSAATEMYDYKEENESSEEYSDEDEDTATTFTTPGYTNEKITVTQPVSMQKTTKHALEMFEETSEIAATAATYRQTQSTPETSTVSKTYTYPVTLENSEETKTEINSALSSSPTTGSFEELTLHSETQTQNMYEKTTSSSPDRTTKIEEIAATHITASGEHTSSSDNFHTLPNHQDVLGTIITGFPGEFRTETSTERTRFDNSFTSEKHQPPNIFAGDATELAQSTRKPFTTVPVTDGLYTFPDLNRDTTIPEFTATSKSTPKGLLTVPTDIPHSDVLYTLPDFNRNSSIAEFTATNKSTPRRIPTVPTDFPDTAKENLNVEKTKKEKLPWIKHVYPALSDDDIKVIDKMYDIPNEFQNSPTNHLPEEKFVLIRRMFPGLSDEDVYRIIGIKSIPSTEKQTKEKIQRTMKVYPNLTENDVYLITGMFEAVKPKNIPPSKREQYIKYKIQRITEIYPQLSDEDVYILVTLYEAVPKKLLASKKRKEDTEARIKHIRKIFPNLKENDIASIIALYEEPFSTKRQKFPTKQHIKEKMKPLKSFYPELEEEDVYIILALYEISPPRREARKTTKKKLKLIRKFYPSISDYDVYTIVAVINSPDPEKANGKDPEELRKIKIRRIQSALPTLSEQDIIFIYDIYHQPVRPDSKSPSARKNTKEKIRYVKQQFPSLSDEDIFLIVTIFDTNQEKGEINLDLENFKKQKLIEKIGLNESEIDTVLQLYGIAHPKAVSRGPTSDSNHSERKADSIKTLYLLLPEEDINDLLSRYELLPLTEEEGSNLSKEKIRIIKGDRSTMSDREVYYIINILKRSRPENETDPNVQSIMRRIRKLYPTLNDKDIYMIASLFDSPYPENLRAADFPDYISGKIRKINNMYPTITDQDIYIIVSMYGMAYPEFMPETEYAKYKKEKLYFIRLKYPYLKEQDIRIIVAVFSSPYADNLSTVEIKSRLEEKLRKIRAMYPRLTDSDIMFIIATYGTSRPQDLFSVKNRFDKKRMEFRRILYPHISDEDYMTIVSAISVPEPSNITEEVQVDMAADKVKKIRAMYPYMSEQDINLILGIFSLSHQQYFRSPEEMQFHKEKLQKMTALYPDLSDEDFQIISGFYEIIFAEYRAVHDYRNFAKDKLLMIKKMYLNLSDQDIFFIIGFYELRYDLQIPRGEANRKYAKERLKIIKELYPGLKDQDIYFITGIYDIPQRVHVPEAESSSYKEGLIQRIKKLYPDLRDQDVYNINKIFHYKFAHYTEQNPDEVNPSSQEEQTEASYSEHNSGVIRNVTYGFKIPYKIVHADEQTGNEQNTHLSSLKEIMKNLTHGMKIPLRIIPVDETLEQKGTTEKPSYGFFRVPVSKKPTGSRRRKITEPGTRKDFNEMYNFFDHKSRLTKNKDVNVQNFGNDEAEEKENGQRNRIVVLRPIRARRNKGRLETFLLPYLKNSMLLSNNEESLPSGESLAQLWGRMGPRSRRKNAKDNIKFVEEVNIEKKYEPFTFSFDDIVPSRLLEENYSPSSNLTLLEEFIKTFKNDPGIAEVLGRIEVLIVNVSKAYNNSEKYEKYVTSILELLRKSPYMTHGDMKKELISIDRKAERNMKYETARLIGYIFASDDYILLKSYIDDLERLVNERLEYFDPYGIKSKVKELFKMWNDLYEARASKNIINDMSPFETR